MSTDDSPDVVVVGAGVIGCAVANALASDHDVLVLDRGQVAGATTGRAAGMVTVVSAYSEVPGAATTALATFRELDGTGEFAFVERPSLELVTPVVEEHARTRTARLRGEGWDASFLPADEVAERYPRFDVSEFTGAIRFEETGWVDPYTYAMTLKDLAESEGAEFRTNTEVERVATAEGAVVGVETVDGTIPASTVVCATGWRTRRLLEGVVSVPVRPFRLQAAVLDPGAGNVLGADFPMGWDNREFYWRPERNGNLLIGGGERAVDDPEATGGDVDPAFRERIARRVPEFLREFGNAQFVDGWAGVDAATPDTEPIVDAPDDAPEGLVVATGFQLGGIMSAPIAAAGVRSIVTGEACEFPVERFSMDRFDRADADFTFESVSARSHERT